MNEMTTLASIGDMPALPMGLRYPRGLFGKSKRSKRIRFPRLGKLKEHTMKFIVIPDFLSRFEETGSTKRRNKNKKREIEARQGEKEHPETMSKYKDTTANQINHAKVARGLHRTGSSSIWDAMKRKEKHRMARGIKKDESITEARFEAGMKARASRRASRVATDNDIIDSHGRIGSHSEDKSRILSRRIKEILAAKKDHPKLP